MSSEAFRTEALAEVRGEAGTEQQANAPAKNTSGPRQDRRQAGRAESRVAVATVTEASPEEAAAAAKSHSTAAAVGRPTTLLGCGNTDRQQPIEAHCVGRPARSGPGLAKEPCSRRVGDSQHENLGAEAGVIGRRQKTAELALVSAERTWS